MKRPLLIAAGWAWAAAIVWLSLTPSPPDAGFEQSDKLGHVLSYALLMGWFACLYRTPLVRAAHACAFIAMGIGLEFLQAQTAYRTYEVADMVSNAAGVLIGWAAWRLVPRIRAR